MGLMRHQSDVGNQNPMPTDRVDDAATVTAVSGETLTWLYNNSGAWGSATGEAAGTIVLGKLKYDSILDSGNGCVGHSNDTSLSFAASTRFDTLIDVPEDVFSKMQELSVAEKVAYITPWLSTNGYYAIDHRRGQIWGIAKAQVADDSVSYDIKAPVAGSGGPSTNVAVTAQVPGTGATNLGKAEDAAHTSGDTGVMALAVRNDSGAALAGTDGDYIPLTTDPNGNLRVKSSGGGGSTGGGDGVYSTEQQDFTATITDSSRNIVLSVDSVGGQAIDENNFANGLLKVWDASTEEMVTIELDDFTWTAATKTLAVANCTGAFTFNTGDVVSLTITGPRIQDDRDSDAKKVVEQKPIWTRHAGDTLASLTNIAANTTGYAYFTLDGYKPFALQCETSGTTPTDTLTLTVEATWQDDGTADSSCTYQDVTSSWFGVASVVDADCVFDKDTPTTAKYVRLKYVTSNTGGNDADLTVYLRRTY